MLTNKIRKRIEIPGEAGEWLEIRMVSGKKLEEARKAKQMEAFATLRAMGKDGLEAVQGMTRAEADAVVAADPLAEYDLDVLLRSGVVGWSYDEPFAPTKVDELDAATREWAAGEIVALSRREDPKNC